MSTETPDDLACRDFTELVTDYLDGALAPELTARIDRHLADCPGCQSYLAQIRATQRMLGHLPEDAVERMPAEMRGALLAAYHAPD